MERDSKDQIARAVGRIPSGVFILTARCGERRMGMLASWVQQAGLNPLAVSVAVHKGRPIEPLIDESWHFVLNQIGTDPKPLFRHFGRGFEPNQDAFAGLNVTNTPAGVLLADCPSAISCRVHAKYEACDHCIYVGEVIDAVCQEDFEPYVHLRKNGSSY